MSRPDDTIEQSEHDIAREKEMEAMLERRFRHVDLEHPAMAVLWKESQRHWMAFLRNTDEG